MASARLALAVALAVVASPALAIDQREVGAAHLSPITRDYQAKIAAWGTHFYADPNALLGASVSRPELTRDGSGRLLWLVCLEAPRAGPDITTGGVQRHAFGFAPGYFSAPQERRRSTLTRDYCDERSLAWQPFRATVRTARRR